METGACLAVLVLLSGAAAAAWGVDLAVPLWRNFAATAELSGWGNGFGGTTCI